MRGAQPDVASQGPILAAISLWISVRSQALIAPDAGSSAAVCDKGAFHTLSGAKSRGVVVSKGAGGTATEVDVVPDEVVPDVARAGKRGESAGPPNTFWPAPEDVIMRMLREAPVLMVVTEPRSWLRCFK